MQAFKVVAALVLYVAMLTVGAYILANYCFNVGVMNGLEHCQ